MKTLKKGEMFKKDQVSSIRLISWPNQIQRAMLTSCTACPCEGRTGCTRREQLTLGGPTVLLISRHAIPLSRHGVPAWWGSHDYVNSLLSSVSRYPS